jgi:hypothetical protein
MPVVKPKFIPDPAFRGPSEDEAMMAFFDWLRWQKHPAAELTIHVPNELSGKPSKATIFRRARMGVRGGFPDILVCYGNRGFRGAMFEIKVGGGTFSEKQLDWIARLREQGYYADGIRGLDQLIKSWKWYVGLSEELP